LSIRAGPIIGTSLNITFVPFRRRVLVDKPSFNVKGQEEKGEREKLKI